MKLYNIRNKINAPRTLYANRYTLTASQGYVVLLTVLILGAVATTIATTLLMFSTDASKNVLVEEYAARAGALADACAEEALEQIRESSTFAGYNTLTLAGDVCSYNVANLGGQNREARASSTVASVVRKVKITLSQVKPTLTVTSWQDVIDF